VTFGTILVAIVAAAVAAGRLPVALVVKADITAAATSASLSV
jgi:hypothetical protein